MSEFYKRNPSEWMDGTNDLTLEQEAAYSRIVDATALYDQAPRHNIHVLCGLWRCAPRKAERLLKELIDLGKLTIEDGRVVNERAVKEASNRRALSVDRASTGRRGGVESGKSRRKPLKDNNQDEAVGSTRIEENRRESPLTPQGGDGEQASFLVLDPPQQPPEKPDDPFDRFWKVYPRRDAKQAARKKFDKLVKSGVDPERIIAGAITYASGRNGQDPQFTAMPTTWLNQGRWEDETAKAPAKRNTDPNDPRSMDSPFWQKMKRRYGDG